MDKRNEKVCYFTIFFYLCIVKWRSGNTAGLLEKKKKWQKKRNIT